MTVRFQWNIDGFEQMRRSPEVEAELQNAVDKALALLGDENGNYHGGVETGRSRSRGYVVTGDFAAIYDNASNHSLTRALGGL